MNNMKKMQDRHKIPWVLILIFLTMIFIGGCGIGEKYNRKTSPSVVMREDWTVVADSIYVFRSDFYWANMTLVTSNGEGILIDTGANKDDGQRIQQFIEDNNIKLNHIIITHKHTDHFANLNALKLEGMVPVTPENAKEGQIIQLGDKTLKILFTEGHFAPKGHISVELVEDDILIAGDVICNGILPPVGAGGNIFALLDTLKELEKRNYSLIIPGHGDILSTKDLIQLNQEYLNNAKKQVEQLMSKGGTLSDLKKIKLEDCIKDSSGYYQENLTGWHLKNLQMIYLNTKTKGQ